MEEHMWEWRGGRRKAQPNCNGFSMYKRVLFFLSFLPPFQIHHSPDPVATVASIRNCHLKQQEQIRNWQQNTHLLIRKTGDNKTVQLRALCCSTGDDDDDAAAAAAEEGTTSVVAKLWQRGALQKVVIASSCWCKEQGEKRKEVRRKNIKHQLQSFFCCQRRREVLQICE